MGLLALIRVFAALAVVAGADPESSDQVNRCGEAIQADSGSITFPSVGQVTKPGEICIWTIHLQTTSTFRLNLSSLDIPGESEDCVDGGVRIYSLTNLIPPDRAESYTFCNNQPPTDDNFYYLSENLMTVIFHTGYDPIEAGAGFTLNFEGIAFQPILKTHESTYTSASSGIIRHPIEGEYLPNQVQTWLVNAGETRLHLTFSYVDLEECPAAGPPEHCLCDAVVLYEVTSIGLLREDVRLCGQVNNVDVPSLGPNFILALFTDHEDVAGEGSGFDLVYRPETGSTSTTPSPTTTEAPPTTNISTECGGVVFGASGLIEYKPDEPYENLERCVWTVRTPLRSQIRFTMDRMGLEPYFDYVSISTFNSTGSGFVQSALFTADSDPRSVLMEGTVAIVVFHTDSAGTYSGFSLRFVAEGLLDEELAYFKDFHSNPETGRHTLKYPESGEYYQNQELSTFVITRPNDAVQDSIPIVRLNVTYLELEVGPGDACKDIISIFYMPTYEQYVLWQYTPKGGICQLSDLSLNFLGIDTFVLLLASDVQVGGRGFQLEWEVDRVPGSEYQDM